MMEPKSKLWIERAGVVALSDWRVELLEEIERTGSIARAAARMGVPYRTAWYKLRQAEQGLGTKLIETRCGGASGGSSCLTPIGREYLEKYRRFRDGFDRLVAQRFHEVFE